jgi:hypothetical protein
MLPFSFSYAAATPPPLVVVVVVVVVMVQSFLVLLNTYRYLVIEFHKK